MLIFSHVKPSLKVVFSCELRKLKRQEHIQLSHVKRIGVE